MRVVLSILAGSIGGAAIAWLGALVLRPDAPCELVLRWMLVTTMAGGAGGGLFARRRKSPRSAS